MDIEVVKNEGLAREVRVVVPAAELEQKLEGKLAELAKTVRLPGFRPGKVPVAHLRRMYGRQVKAEIVEDAVREGMEQALARGEERAAYQPEVEVEGGEEGAKKVIEENADLAFLMKYEVLPEVELPEDFSDLALQRYRVKIDDKTLNKALEDIAKQFRDFEEKDGAAEEGDRLVIDFVGRIGGEAFEGGSAENVPLELGSGQFIPGFEEQLIGAKAGEERVVKVTFPADYPKQELAGKKAEFTVTVQEVQGPKDTAIDDDFAKKLGFDDLDALKEKVREQLAAEYEQAAEADLKQKVLDNLSERFDFPVPQRLVDAEFEQVWHALEHEMKEHGRGFEDEGTTEEEARKEYREIAERRVRLGLVIGKIGERAGVSVSDEELQQALIAKAQQYPGQERQVIEFYQKTPEALVELRAPLYEGKVLDHLIGQAKVDEKEVTPEELKKLLDEEEEAGKPKKKTTKKKAAGKKTATKKAAAKKDSDKKASTKKAAAKKSSTKKASAKKAAGKKASAKKAATKKEDKA